MSRAFTLLQLLIVVVMLSLLMGVVTSAVAIVLKTWGRQDVALEIQEDARQGVERMLRDLRLAKVVLDLGEDAIRYTVRESGTDRNYIFYLYHPSDPWGLPYTQTAYELRKTSLGVINGTFTYSSGTIYIKSVRPPPTSDLSVTNNVITVDLTASKDTETFHLLEKIRPRNL